MYELTGRNTNNRCNSSVEEMNAVAPIKRIASSLRRIHVQLVPLHFLVQGGAIDVQRFGRALSAPAIGSEGGFNDALLGFFQRLFQ